MNADGASLAVPCRPLLGRSVELARVLAVLARVCRGRGGAVFIEGEPGIGKTALLEAVLAAAVARRGLILRGAAGEWDADRPFGPLLAALQVRPGATDPARAAIGRFLLGGGDNGHGGDSVGGGGGGDSDRGGDSGDSGRGGCAALVRGQVIEAMVAMLERLALTAPVIIALEDMHWTDAPSVLALRHLGQRLARLPVVLLVTARPSPRRPDLSAAMPDGTLRLMLEPLEPSAVSALLEQTARARPGPGLLAVAAQAAGNPRFVTTLVHAIRADGALRVTAGVADATVREAPRSLRALALRHLVTLAPTTRAVLRAAAVLGMTFTLTDVATVLGRRATDLTEALEEACRARVLAETAGQRWTFRHQLVRDAISLDLPAAVRHGPHLRPGQRAPHLVRQASSRDVGGADPGHHACGRCHRGRGGLHLFDLGRWDEAVTELRAASEAVGEHAGAPSAFAEAILAVIAVHRGSLHRADTHLANARLAVAEGGRPGAGTVMWAGALTQDARGDRRAATTTLEAAWQLHLHTGARTRNERLSLDLVRLALAVDRTELAAGVAGELAALAETRPSPSRSARALLCTGLARSDPDLLRAAVTAYDRSPWAPEAAWARLAAGEALGRAGLHDEAITLLRQGIAGCEAIGAAHDVARADVVLRGLGGRRARRTRRRRPVTGWESLTPAELAVARLAVQGLTNARIGALLSISGRTVETHFSHIFAKLQVSSRVQVAIVAADQMQRQTPID